LTGFEELFFAIDHGIDVVGGELESMTMSDRVGGAGLDAVSTKNAARIIDIVDGGVAFGGGDAIGFGIFGGLDIDAARGAGCGAKKTGDALLESIFIALQDVDAAIARLKMHGLVRVIFRRRLSPKIAKGDAEALGQRRDCVADFSDDCHILRIHLPVSLAARRPRRGYILSLRFPTPTAVGYARFVPHGSYAAKLGLGDRERRACERRDDLLAVKASVLAKDFAGVFSADDDSGQL